MNSIVNINSFKFKYSNKYILNNINIKVSKGKCLGLLGRNGSGKTTLINCILGELKGEGDIEVLGEKPNIYSRKFKQYLGVVLDNDILIDYLTLNEYLLYVGRLFEISEDELDCRIEYWIKTFELQNHANRILKYFSHGMRKKVQIISALIHEPKLLIIDEPTNGLDIEMIYILKNVIKRLKDTGLTIFVSTHIISFVEDVCDEVIIINNGTIREKIQLPLNNKRLEDVFIKEIKDCGDVL